MAKLPAHCPHMAVRFAAAKHPPTLAICWKCLGKRKPSRMKPYAKNRARSERGFKNVYEEAIISPYNF